MLDFDGIPKSNIFKDDNFIDPCLCSAWVATAIVGASVVGAASTVYAASKASDAQVTAADKAAQTTLGMYERTRNDLAPYRKMGEDAYATLQPKLKDLTDGVSIDPDMLKDSDYYRFAEKEGLRAAQNSAAARGLGKSGAALKGAINFAEGLATGTYKDAFNMAVTNQTNTYNRLKSLIDLGANASAQTGTAGTSAANSAATAQIGAGNAQAAGYNAMGGAINNAANNIGGYAAYKGLYGGDRGASNAGSSVRVGGNFGEAYAA